LQRGRLPQCCHTIGWGGEVKTKVAQHGLEPNEFHGSGSKGAVFGFSAGASNCPLFAGGPRNNIWAEKNTKATSRFSIAGAAYSVSI
jgi:hypothetical protein